LGPYWPWHLLVVASAYAALAFRFDSKTLFSLALTSFAAWRGGGGGGGAPPPEPAQPQVLVGFAAETDTSPEQARAKLTRKGCDLLVVNPVGNGLGFGTPDNEAVVYGADGTVTPISRGPKDALADVVWDLIAARLNETVSRG
jgi:hypothetical protein